MKKTAVLAMMMLVAFGMQAQDNIVKLGLGSALNSTINLEYERVLTENTSAFVELGFGLGANLGDGTISATGIEGGQNGIAVNSGRYSSFYFVGEYRYYTKGEGPKGFYIAPYLKFSNYSFDFEGTYNNIDNGFTDVPAEINTGMFVAAIGGTMGYQWLINDKIAINWNILGIGGSLNTISAGFTADDEDVFAAWEEDIRDFLSEIPGGSSFDVTSDNDAKTIDTAGSFGFVNLRVSVSVGYKF